MLSKVPIAGSEAWASSNAVHASAYSFAARYRRPSSNSLSARSFSGVGGAGGGLGGFFFAGGLGAGVGPERGPAAAIAGAIESATSTASDFIAPDRITVSRAPGRPAPAP